jgi:hypothetical protein
MNGFTVASIAAHTIGKFDCLAKSQILEPRTLALMKAIPPNPAVAFQKRMEAACQLSQRAAAILDPIARLNRAITAPPLPMAGRV